jgi:outer membrane protein OmpA-like peptidoglycan-associated protein
MTTHMQHPLSWRLALVLALAAAPAAAQVNVDRRALDPLQPKPEQGTEKPAQKPPAKPPARPATRQPNHSQAPATPTPPPPPPVARPEPPTIPAAPPAPPVVPPPIAVPARPPIAPSPVAVAADAPGMVTQITGGIRATFGAGRSDMNPDMEKALRAFARAMPPGASMTVIATAAGAPEDPSTPRRMSLSRGLAVRSLTISEGIVSTRIVVRAIGANPITAIAGAQDGPADRADITLTLPPANPPATPAAAAPRPATPAQTAPTQAPAR